jgi:phosphopantetheinyl transferase
MPLFYQHNINASTRLAVWHITEDEDFFMEKVVIKKEITHPHKRLQHLAGRYLLGLLFPDFPLHLIEIAESRKPLLTDGRFHFSISHCGTYAGVIVSENRTVGIDVELVTPRIELVKNKFLNESEMALAESFEAGLSMTRYQLLTLFWSSKEAIFKWYGKGKVDFKKNMIIDRMALGEDQGTVFAHFMKEDKIDLTVQFHFFGSLCLAWVAK